MFNKVILAGNVTRDVELRYTPNGKATCTIGLAVNGGYGEHKETLFIDIVVWGKQAETMAQYLSKGRQIIVEGRLTEDTWEKDGQKHRKAKVVANDVRFIGAKQRNEGAGPDEVSDIEPF